MAASVVASSALDPLIAWARAHGRLPSRRDWDRSRPPHAPSRTTLMRRFGSWAAVRAALAAQMAPQPRVTPSPASWARAVAFWRAAGPLSSPQWDRQRPPTAPPARTLYRWFGTWSAATAALTAAAASPSSPSPAAPAAASVPPAASAPPDPVPAPATAPPVRRPAGAPDLGLPAHQAAAVHDLITAAARLIVAFTAAPDAAAALLVRLQGG